MKYIIVPVFNILWAIGMTFMATLIFVLTLIWYLNFEKAYDIAINGVIINVCVVNTKKQWPQNVITYKTIWHWAVKAL